MKAAPYFWAFVFALSVFSVSAATLPAGFVEEQIGGTWNEAVGLTFDANGRMYVWERAGRVWIVENGVKSSTPFLDIHDEVGGWRDFGLLGFCLHPNFLNNGYVYVSYVVDRHHLLYFGTPNYSSDADLYFAATIGRITRYTARSSDGFRSVDPSSRKVLLGESITNGFPVLFESHGTGTILFGNDGTLLASAGDGASYSGIDPGSVGNTYYAQALADGIITPAENVGAFRAQMLTSLNGKIVRLDPLTGDGVPSNPFFDPGHPRSARSRLWAMGFRNPFRMTLRPLTGSPNPADARPGSLYIGDVGHQTWEELNICTRPGQNFGWPIFEGINVYGSYYSQAIQNREAPNPQYPNSGCTEFFYFRDLVKQLTTNTAGFPPFNNPCATSVKIPSAIPQWLQTPPVVDWHHDDPPSRTWVARTWMYGADGVATNIDLNDPNSPVPGPIFPGNCSTAGAWYTNAAHFPPQYQNTYFHSDYGVGWIRNFLFDSNDRPVAVRDFLSDGGGVVALGVEPQTGYLYYISWAQILRRIRYTAAANQAPTADASADRYYGPSPLNVSFSSAGSFDPEGQALTFAWDFGDGSTSTLANPSHTMNAPGGVPTPRTVTLVVTDAGGAKATNRVVISLNNTPPTVNITSPVDGSYYSITNQTIVSCTANITDLEQGPTQRTCVWQTFLHHNDHEHEEPPDTNCTTSTVISPIGCDGQAYYYRVVLTVADAAGLSATNEVRLYPNCFGTMRLHWLNRDAAGQVSIGIDALLNVPYTIEASTNLRQWNPVATVTNTAGRLDFVDPLLPAQRSRFYRATAQ